MSRSMSTDDTVDPPRILLVSSNPRKLEAFRSLGLDVGLAAGVDLPEVDGSPDEVAVRKSEAAGPGTLVEDTILELDGVPVVDVRWRIGDLEQMAGAQARFLVTLAENDGERVRLWRGSMDGTLGRASTGGPSFGFDPWIYPEGADGLSLDDLARAGRTNEFSARARAAHAYMHEEPILEVRLADLGPWTGSWQGGYKP